MADPAHSCCVVFRGVPRSVRRTAIKTFGEQLRLHVAKGLGFECLIAGDGELAQLNSAFLKKAYAPDVLSFPSASPGGYLGEVAISWQRAREQAAAFGHPVEQEIEILMLHGLLHLLGHDHESDTGRMARAERRWRKKLGLPGGLIERSRP